MTTPDSRTAEEAAADYEAMLSGARNDPVVADVSDETLTRVVARMRSSRVRVRVRRAVAQTCVLATLVIAMGQAMEVAYARDSLDSLVQSLFVVGWVASVLFALRRPTVGFQLYGRSVLLGVAVPLLLQMPLAVLGGARVSGLQWLAAGLCAVPLIVLAGDRLSPDGGPFSPLRYRLPLLISIVANGALAFFGLKMLFGYAVQLWLAEDVALFVPIRLKWVALDLGVMTAAFGIYYLRAVALLVPIVVGGYAIVTEIWSAVRAGPDPFSGRGDDGMFLVASVVAGGTSLAVIWGIYRLRQEKPT